MWLRSIVAGFGMALLLVASMTNGVTQWLMGGHESYMFGSVMDNIAPTLVSASGVGPLVHLVVASMMLVVMTMIGAMIWQFAERGIIGLAGALSKLNFKVLKH